MFVRKGRCCAFGDRVLSGVRRCVGNSKFVGNFIVSFVMGVAELNSLVKIKSGCVIKKGVVNYKGVVVGGSLIIIYVSPIVGQQIGVTPHILSVTSRR